MYALCRLCIRYRKPVRGIRNKRELGTGFGHHKCLGCIIGRGRCMQYGQPDPGIQKKMGQKFIICLCIQCRIPQTLARHLRRSDVRILTRLAHLTGHRSEIMQVHPSLQGQQIVLIPLPIRLQLIRLHVRLPHISQSVRQRFILIIIVAEDSTRIHIRLIIQYMVPTYGSRGISPIHPIAFHQLVEHGMVASAIQGKEHPVPSIQRSVHFGIDIIKPHLRFGCQITSQQSGYYPRISKPTGNQIRPFFLLQRALQQHFRGYQPQAGTPFTFLAVAFAHTHVYDG